MIERVIASNIVDLASWYPIVSVAGPRQSGKTTLVKSIFTDYEYVNLEDPQVFSRATIDPSGFVASLSPCTIIDEAQRAPELFSALQARVDRDSIMGEFILSGSQNFLLLRSIEQSLAGRVGIAYLPPLTHSELFAYDKDSSAADQEIDLAIQQEIVRGFYPGLHVSPIPTPVFYDNYVDTYVTRDVVGYLDVRNESDFRSFLVACADRAGSLVNYAGIARDVGVSVQTVKSWLSILQSSFLIHLLRPYAANVSKRLTKAPKLYFLDTGLLCHLLSIQSGQELARSSHYGSVFESFIISEQLKRHYAKLRRPALYFYRDDSKIEVDMLDLTPRAPRCLCEIKSSTTYRSRFSSGVRTVARDLDWQQGEMDVIYAGTGSFQDGDVHVYGAQEWLDR